MGRCTKYSLQKSGFKPTQKNVALASTCTQSIPVAILARGRAYMLTSPGQRESRDSKLLKVHILGISGSLRRGSFNTSALHAAAELLAPGASLEILDISSLPIFNQDCEYIPPSAVVDLKSKIRAADALLIATPEHNYSISAALKNALDWGSRPYGDNAWFGKPAAILGAAPGGVGTARAQYHLRQICVYLNIFPVNQPEVMIMEAPRRFDENGRLADEASRVHITALPNSLIGWTVRVNGSCLPILQAGNGSSDAAL